ncbi:lysozyme inhibitor LprI family protein [Nioella sp.]|uniref:lysozyme inhibitor LprI family protein n=1 Tax=Nioella sp. TaxID=1912091 RepID=UPI003B517DD3
MEAFIAFCLGFLADLARSAFLPWSTDWLAKFIPPLRRKRNIDENLLLMRTMNDLEALGKDPMLVKHLHEDADSFMRKLESQRQAYVEHALDAVDTTYMTQAEMNNEAARMADIAKSRMMTALAALERSGTLDEEQIDELKRSQSGWEEYAEQHASVVAHNWRGGSIAPSIYYEEWKSLAISREGQLRSLLEEFSE